MMIYNGLYMINNKELVEKNGQHSGGRGFVKTSGATEMARNIGQFIARFQSLCIISMLEPYQPLFSRKQGTPLTLHCWFQRTLHK